MSITSSKAEASSAEPAAWKTVTIDLTALRNIIAEHLSAECMEPTFLGQGRYAKTYLFTLKDDRPLVGRVALPMRDALKTGAEVAVMSTFRG